MTDLYKYDSGEPIFLDDIKKASEEQQQEMKTQLLKRVMDFKETFSTPAGERVLIWLMYEMYLFRSYNQHNAGAYALEGKREIANDLVDMLGGEYILERLISAKNQFNKEKTDD